MIKVKNKYAMAEVLWYLNGIRKEDVDKIPKDIIEYFKENAARNFKCDFDYNKPLNELKLRAETRGIIAMLCYKYWCDTEEKKINYYNKLSSNEKMYQEFINQKYSEKELNEKEENNFVVNDIDPNQNLIERKETVFQKIFLKIRSLFSNKR